MQIRGFQVDLRAQTLRADYIIEVMQKCAGWGYNTMLLEYCDKFPYTGQFAPAVAPDALTRDEIAEINRAADALGIQIIPLVQCLGHYYWILRLPRFTELAEGANNADSPELAYNSGIRSTLCPTRPSTMELFKDLAGQVLAAHPGSKFFHMAGDEAFLDEKCALCGPRIGSEGKAGIFREHYSMSAEWLRSKGVEPIMWCDMLLRHPDSLDGMVGKATLMDWDYWSTEVPYDRQHVWGVDWRDFTEPEKWPEDIRRIIAPLFFTLEGRKSNPFPYNRFLAEKGFQVINGPAIRSAGDSFCVPKENSVENVIGSVKAAHRNGTLGTIITSWALRRAPWPTTEFALIAGGMTMMNPDVTREEIDTRFAEEHFGISDPELARIPVLLGSIRFPLCESMPRIDRDGHWPGESYEKRIGIMREHVSLESLAEMRKSLQEARSLLERAERILPSSLPPFFLSIWQWAADTLEYYLDFAPQVYKEPGTHDPEELAAFIPRAQALDRRTDELLSPIITDFTLLDEKQTRFGMNIGWIEEMIEFRSAKA